MSESIRGFAELPEVPMSSLKAHIPDLLAKDTTNYLVEYGIRITDDAMVFHFFAPVGQSWDEAYAMDKRLEKAIRETFDVSRVSAGFADEMDSFYVIVGGLGAAPDPWPLVSKFFDAIDAAP